MLDSTYKTNKILEFTITLETMTFIILFNARKY